MTSPKPTKKWLVRYLLREAGQRGVTTGEFLQAGCGNRFGARIQDLRERGNVIEAERVRDGEFRYRLTFDADRDVERGTGTPGHRPGTEAAPPPPVDPSLDASSRPSGVDGRGAAHAPAGRLAQPTEALFDTSGLAPAPSMFDFDEEAA